MLNDEGNFSKKRRYDVGTSSSSGSTSYVAARKVTKGLTMVSKTKKKKSKQEMAISKGIKAAVQRLIDNDKETKINVAEDGSLSLVAFSFAGPTGLVNTMTFDDLDSGSDWHQRVGRSINLKRATFNFILTAGANAVDVMVVAISRRDSPSTAFSNGSSDVKITSVGTTTGIQTNADTNSILPWNNNNYEVHFAETYQMSATDIQEGSAATIRRSIDCTKFWPRKIQMNAAASASPAKRVSFLFIPLTVVAAYPTVNIVRVFEYTDA